MGQALLDAAGRQLSAFSSRDLAQTLWAMATLRHRDDKFTQVRIHTFEHNTHCVTVSHLEYDVFHT